MKITRYESTDRFISHFRTECECFCCHDRIAEETAMTHYLLAAIDNPDYAITAELLRQRKQITHQGWRIGMSDLCPNCSKKLQRYLDDGNYSEAARLLGGTK